MGFLLSAMTSLTGSSIRFRSEDCGPEHRVCSEPRSLALWNDDCRAPDVIAVPIVVDADNCLDWDPGE